MTREEFTNMLVEARKAAGYSSTDLVFLMHMLPSDISRMEKAKASYSTGKVFAYLKAVGCFLQVAKDKKTYRIDDNEKLIAWEKVARGKVAKKVFSDSLGFSHDYIRYIESGRNIMSIDKFLKIAEVTGYTIEVAKIK